MSTPLITWDKEPKEVKIPDTSITEEILHQINLERAKHLLGLSYQENEDEHMFEKTSVNVNISYPFSREYEYKTQLKLLNLDEEREKDILSGNGFIISDYQPIQKELKAPNGIFSTKFGQTLSDTNPFIDRYKCKCGFYKSRIYNNVVCPRCNEPVKYVDDNYQCFGWFTLDDPHYVIHPTLYKSLESLIGSQRLINILDKQEEVDTDGHTIEKKKVPKKKRYEPHRKEQKDNEPYYGLGMEWFRKHFEEVFDHYLMSASNKANKQVYYDFIMENRDKLFSQSIPVYTTHLRPYDVSEKSKFAYEPTNSMYTLMSRLVSLLNSSKNLKMYNRHKKSKEKLNFSLLVQFNKLYAEIDKILSGKKGNVRQLAGGRFNFSSRDVIVQNPELQLDNITLPYWCLVDILQQRIIKILTMTYNMSYSDAYQKWYKANISPDKTIIEIINGLIKSDHNGRGLAVIINRNPSIGRGSILQMFCIGMTFDYTMALPLGILDLLGADFDGDVLNVYMIINEAFFQRTFEVFNPRNSMYISNNDGYLNTSVMPYKDNLINANTFIRLGRKNYSKKQLDQIKKVLASVR